MEATTNDSPPSSLSSESTTFWRILKDLLWVGLPPSVTMAWGAPVEGLGEIGGG